MRIVIVRLVGLVLVRSGVYKPSVHSLPSCQGFQRPFNSGESVGVLTELFSPLSQRVSWAVAYESRLVLDSSRVPKAAAKRAERRAASARLEGVISGTGRKL